MDLNIPAGLEAGSVTASGRGGYLMARQARETSCMKGVEIHLALEL